MSVRWEQTGSRLVRGSLAGMISVVFVQGLRLVTAPLILGALGYEAFGFWAITFALLGVAGIHRIGFSGPAIAFGGSRLAKGEIQEANEVFRACATFALLFALIIGPIFFFLAPTIVGFLAESDALVPEMILALRIVTVVTLFSLIFGGYQSGLEATQEHPRLRALDGVMALMEAVALIIVLNEGMGLVAISLVYGARMLLAIPVHAIWMRGLHPGFSALPGMLSRKRTKGVFRVGAEMQLMGIVHLALNSVDRLALAHGPGLMIAGAYEVSKKLMNLATCIPSQTLGPIVPAAARHAKDTEGGGRLLLLLYSTRALAYIAALPLGLFLALAPQVIHAWIGEVPPGVPEALRVLAVATWIHLMTGPVTSMFRGLGQPRPELLYALIWLLLAILLIPAAVGSWGLRGAVYSFAGLQATGALLFLVLTLPRLRVSRGEFVRATLGPLGTTVPPVLVLLIAGAFNPDGMTRWGAMGQVFFGACFLLATSALMALQFVCSPDERAALLARLPLGRRPERKEPALS